MRSHPFCASRASEVFKGARTRSQGMEQVDGQLWFSCFGFNGSRKMLQTRWLAWVIGLPGMPVPCHRRRAVSKRCTGLFAAVLNPVRAMLNPVWAVLNQSTHPVRYRRIGFPLTASNCIIPEMEVPVAWAIQRVIGVNA